MGLCFRIVLRQSPFLGSSPVYADVSGRTLEWLLLPSFARAMKGPFSDSHDEQRMYDSIPKPVSPKGVSFSL